MTVPAVLVGSDLLLASRLRAALGGLRLVAGGAEVAAADLVFVDLNQHVEERLLVIRALRARGTARIVGFCSHEARATRIAAMEAGADEVVTNGWLPAAAARAASTP
ncbi:MAG: response regulator [Candidatus Dormibacteria bacterium]